jgi:hypothetical protein
MSKIKDNRIRTERNILYFTTIENESSSLYLRGGTEVQRTNCQPGIEPTASELEAGQFAVLLAALKISLDECLYS